MYVIQLLSTFNVGDIALKNLQNLTETLSLQINTSTYVLSNNYIFSYLVK